jgi:hypothetical protein
MPTFMIEAYTDDTEQAGGAYAVYAPFALAVATSGRC